MVSVRPLRGYDVIRLWDFRPRFASPSFAISVAGKTFRVWLAVSVLGMVIKKMIAAEVRKNLLAVVSAYRKATGASDSEVSKRFYGNVSFIDKFRSGDHSISVDKLDAMIADFRAKWPEGAEWPMLRPIFMDRQAQARK